MPAMPSAASAAGVVSALKSALADKTVRACTARDLREACAVEALIEGLNCGDADTQVQLPQDSANCTIHAPSKPLGVVALNDNVLVASSAISALGAYESKVALPYCCAPRPDQRVRRHRAGIGRAIARSRGPRLVTPRSRQR